MAENDLTIAVIDPDRVRAAILEEGLTEAGFKKVVFIEETAQLIRQLNDIAPDVVIIDLESPNRDVLEQMFQVSRIVERPVARFVDHSEEGMIEAAIEAGVSAYVVDGLRKERVSSIVNVAISRFNAFTRLRGELESAKTQLAERKTVERAKGILMKRQGMSEEEAFRLLRQTAMNEKKKLVEIAESVLTAAKLFGGDE
ncbi:MAG: ANTAR domain-containing protein [Pseudomonadota bacterium]